MARFKLQLAQGVQRDDIDDLLQAHDAEVVNVEGNEVTVDVSPDASDAFADDADQDFNIACIDEMKWCR